MIKLPNISNRILLGALTLILMIFPLFALYKLYFKNPPASHNANSLTCKDCNVILISIDALRYNRLGIDGYEKNISASIDQFFKDSVVFENAHVQSSWTLPSHAAMLTGVYPKKFKVEISFDSLPPDAETLAETLREHGYQTAAFSTGTFVSADQGFGQGFDFFKHYQDWKDAKTITGDSSDWLQKEAKKKKFFLFIHPFHVHDPYAPSKKYIKKIDPNYTGKLNNFDISQIVKLGTGNLKFAESDLNRISALYDADIAELDDYFSQVFNRIKSMGLEKNTIVILTSDHGDELGERGLWGVHGYSLYEELLHVPLIFKIPSAEPKRISTLAGSVDIYPTVLELLAIQNKIKTDGQSLIGAYLGNQPAERVIFAETAYEKNQLLQNIEGAYQENFAGTFRQITRGSAGEIPQAKALINNNYKLIQNFNGSTELYDLQKDPEEKNNLVNSLGEIKDKLQTQLNKIVENLK